MTATSTAASTAVAVSPAVQAGAEAPVDSAAELLNAMAAMPAGHPSRAALRDRAIEATTRMASTFPSSFNEITPRRARYCVPRPRPEARRRGTQYVTGQ